MILDLWGMTFHTMVVIALILALLLESISAYCGTLVDRLDFGPVYNSIYDGWPETLKYGVL